MNLCDCLKIPKGVIAVVGGGGKTTLIDYLSHQLPGRVLRLTTTHIWPPACQCLIAPTPQRLGLAFQENSVIAVGEIEASGKMIRPAAPLPPLFALADYVLVEADGSRGLPLKAPDDLEPVFTGMEQLVIAVAGMKGLEVPIGEAAHHPERYGALIGKSITAKATPEDVAMVLESPFGQKKGVTSAFAVVLNQCDSPQRLAFGLACKKRLKEPCVVTALQGSQIYME